MAGAGSYVSLPDNRYNLSTSLLPGVSSAPSESYLNTTATASSESEQPTRRTLLQKLHPYRYYILIVGCTALVLLCILGVVLTRDSEHYRGYTPPSNSTSGDNGGGSGNGGRPGPPSGPGGDSGAPGGGPGGDGGDTGSGGGDISTNSSCLNAKVLTEGPYWIDEKLNRTDLLATSVGQMLSMELMVYNTSVTDKCLPIANAMVDLWTSDGAGLYSDVQSEGTKGKTFLRGYQVTNADGLVNFLTIWPGWYRGRTVHMHVRVRVFSADGKTVVINQTTQLFLDDPTSDSIFAAVSPYNARTGKRDTYNSNDGLYSAAMFMNTTGSIKAGFHGSFALGVPFIR